ncbi:hypothetical protein MTR67_050955 [Solanum verrucosum]|uniref:Uncharacterized protein n=1 Tax=Solanum verrucosum TaxID=315347 RepID=A0AAF0V474_SOLVR|nr:hypothetical protein MTR67_050955 [Solanum verrucosum]
MIHNKKVEFDSIRKERNRLKKIVEDMITNEISELNDMNTIEIFDLKKVYALKDKMPNLELMDGIESSNLKKGSGLNDNVLKLELKVHQLINLIAVSWAIIIDFVDVKMM